MSEADQRKWDAKYQGVNPVDALSPNPWLCERVEAMPPGKVLDLACGLGDNALWLSRQGWDVDAVDISAVGLGHAAERANRLGLRVNWIHADLNGFSPAIEGFDLVTVFRYLDREYVPKIAQTALRPGGILLFETFSHRQLQRQDNHIQNPAFLLAEGELPRLFPNLDVLEQAEVDLEDRAVARLVAKCPLQA